MVTTAQCTLHSTLLIYLFTYFCCEIVIAYLLCCIVEIIFNILLYWPGRGIQPWYKNIFLSRRPHWKYFTYFKNLFHFQKIQDGIFFSTLRSDKSIVTNVWDTSIDYRIITTLDKCLRKQNLDFFLTSSSSSWNTFCSTCSVRKLIKKVQLNKLFYIKYPHLYLIPF